jgi:hypothetical protein
VDHFYVISGTEIYGGLASFVAFDVLRASKKNITDIFNPGKGAQSPTFDALFLTTSTD